MAGKIFTIEDPIYLQHLGIYVGEAAWFLRIMGKRFDPGIIEVLEGGTIGSSAATYCIDEPVGDVHHIIWMKDFDRTYDWARTLDHEMIHFSMRIIGEVGIPMTPSSNEALAYYYSFMKSSALKKLLKWVDSKPRSKKRKK